METKFKDVAHLYKNVDILICEPGIEPVSHYLEGIDWHLNKVIAERVSYPIEWIKPILSRLEDMTEEDWIKCFELSRGAYDQNYNATLTRMSPTEMEFTMGKAQFIFGFHRCFDNDVRIGAGLCFFSRRYLIKEELAVGETGIESHETGYNDLKIEQVLNVNHIFLYLLSKGYDLFNLIPSGEAIDRKTL